MGLLNTTITCLDDIHAEFCLHSSMKKKYVESLSLD